jgi:hypothetical protein
MMELAYGSHSNSAEFTGIAEDFSHAVDSSSSSYDELLEQSNIVSWEATRTARIWTKASAAFRLELARGSTHHVCSIRREMNLTARVDICMEQAWSLPSHVIRTLLLAVRADGLRRKIFHPSIQGNDFPNICYNNRRRLRLSTHQRLGY